MMIKEKTANKMAGAMVVGIIMMAKKIKTCCTILINQTPPWRLQEGENFSKVFYKKQKECPKTGDGKLICMKFFVRGLCDKSCSRAHSLSKEDSKKFEKFLADCCKAAAKKDF
jgi:hypothetical protein